MPTNSPIRTQDEILARYTAALARSEVEALELLRQMTYETAQRLTPAPDIQPTDQIEGYKDIDRSAKLALGWMLRNITRSRPIKTTLAQYTSWKWMLGHPDADTFYGSCEDPRLIYIKLRQQIEGTEWDRLTECALRNTKTKGKR